MPHHARNSDAVPEEVRAYLAAIPAEHQPLLERLLRLIDEITPGITPGISYKMLCWKAGPHHLYVGAFKHGLSVYGWSQGRETPVTDRHPEIKTSKGTIRLTPVTAAQLTDDELRVLLRAALTG